MKQLKLRIVLGTHLFLEKEENVLHPSDLSSAVPSGHKHFFCSLSYSLSPGHSQKYERKSLSDNWIEFGRDIRIQQLRYQSKDRHPFHYEFIAKSLLPAYRHTVYPRHQCEFTVTSFHCSSNVPCRCCT